MAYDKTAKAINRPRKAHYCNAPVDSMNGVILLLATGMNLPMLLV
jgi:hypothetical protein